MAPSRLGLAPLRRVVGATLVVLLLVGAVLYYRAPPSSPVAAPSPSTGSSADGSSVPDAEPLPSAPTPQATGSDGSPSAEAAIEIYGDNAIRAQPFETVRIQGTYHGGVDAFLRVDVREGARWVPYPFRPKTDHLGRFITHIELGEPGPHWLRVVDPRTELTSEPFVLVIAG